MKKPSRAKGSAQPKITKSGRELERQIKQSERSRIKADKRRHRENLKRDKEYSRRLKQLERIGAYTPKSHSITKYRKTRINKLARQFVQYLDPKEWAFVPAGKKTVRKARSLRMITTNKGILIQREGFTKHELKFNPEKPGELAIIRRNQIKRGPNAGKVRNEIIPLADVEEIISEPKHLESLARQHFYPLQKNERLAFIIRTNDVEGYSYNMFENVEDLIHELKTKYADKRSDAAGIELFRHVTIVKTKVGKWLRHKHTYEENGKEHTHSNGHGRIKRRRAR